MAVRLQSYGVPVCAVDRRGQFTGAIKGRIKRTIGIASDRFEASVTKSNDDYFSVGLYRQVVDIIPGADRYRNNSSVSKRTVDRTIWQKPCRCKNWGIDE